jgi:hypothetical protein
MLFSTTSPKTEVLSKRFAFDGKGIAGAVFLDQTWPDGSTYLETGSAYVTSLDQLSRLPHAEQSMIERMYEAKRSRVHGSTKAR